MTGFTNVEEGIKHFLVKGWHAIWHSPAVQAATPEVESALLSVAKSTVSAALEAGRAEGATGQSILAASLKAAEDSAKEQEGPLLAAGVTITGQQLGSLAGLATAHAQTALPPPQ